MSLQGSGHAAYCYAQALLSLVLDEATSVSSEIEEILCVFREKDVREFFSSPVVPKDAKVAAWRDVCSTCAIGRTLTNFVCVVIVNGKFPILHDIFEKFRLLLMRHRGEFDLEIISASPLSENEEKKILSLLEKYGKPGSVSKCVDPEVLGGFIAKGDSFFIDASVRGHLCRLNDFSREVVLSI
ncbi:ATP synthase F1 subunit delta [Anaplasma bovis]|uniref:ATP synthase F1 subunit delta n=1 Tax=Anaplasma bovis TaxID=186733 RepID=UPI002FEF8F84